MKLLRTLDIAGRAGRRIELYQGDLTALAESERFDLLVVSAFPDDYLPTSTSLIGALHRKGLSTQALANDKEIDLREHYSCWLSREFRPQNPGLKFRRLLCFEPLVRGHPPEVVGDIFQALIPILAEAPDIKTIAMPVVATGNEGHSTVSILKPLLDAARHWLKNGLPLQCIKIVAYSDDQASEAIRIFDAALPKSESKKMRATANLAAAPAASLSITAPDYYDVFVSYSRTNAHEADALVEQLRASRPGIKIFLDRQEIDVGAAWQLRIFESLDQCKKVVAMLSPAYLNSKVCKEEYGIAWTRGRDENKDIIFPIYLYSTNLPTYMKYKNYVDCREGDNMKIATASSKLLECLDEVEREARAALI